MALTALIGILTAFIIVVVLAYRNPEAAQRWYGRYKAAQTVVWGAFAGLVGLVLLSSGQPLLIISGLIIWVAIAAALVVDGPLWGVLLE